MSYEITPDAALLSTHEAALISRLDTTTPSNAFIAGDPRTGASLAYALADREVMEKHVFGTRTADEILIDQHLRDIDTDPAVCKAVRRLGLTHVLDFGSHDIFNDPNAAAAHAGVQNLAPSAHLVLIDSDGPHARLFKIEGC